MSLSTLTSLLKTGLCAALDGPVVGVLAARLGAKAVSILKEHFTFTAYEIAETYEESYGYGLAAISAGLAAPDHKLAFLQKLTRSKITREFSDQLDQYYLQPFAQERGLDNEELPALRKRLLEKIKKLAKQTTIFEAENVALTESELAAFINHTGTLAITELVLEQLFNQGPEFFERIGFTFEDEEELVAFLRYGELLGNAVLFFFRERLRKDERAEKTLSALQREGLWADVRDIKAAQQTLSTQLEQELETQKQALIEALQAGQFANAPDQTQQLQILQNRVEQLPEQLEMAHTAWQGSQEQLIAFSNRFNSWAQLLETKVDQVLDEIGSLQGSVDRIDENVDTLLQEFRQFMQRFELSKQVKPRDEFTQHNTTSLKLIQEAVGKLKGVPINDPQYNELVLAAGSVLSSTGNIAEAERLFLEAKETAQNDAEKALSCFNLFQVRLRRKAYPEALAELETAISIDPQRYALHDVHRYPIERLLGAGGMGCVFLCQNQWRNNKVVVKCFWEEREGQRDEIFGEAMIMRKIAGDYVPEPLDYGYVDAARQDRPYFVTEYLEESLDGESWLAQYGKLDSVTGIQVGLQVAEGLQIAHKQGIYHLDLKPANLLMKKTENGINVKIIDFGLARVGTSLKEEALSRRDVSGMTQFGQTILGTLDYAPPEQLGHTACGKPGPKSDLFSFGATLYRLMTGESPRHLNPRRLGEAPTALFELLCDCKEERPSERPEIIQVIQRLEEILNQNTLIVSPTGDYPTITAAIEEAHTGSRILIKPGIYQESLILDKPLHLIGEGAMEEIIVESQTGRCVWMKTEQALIRGLSLRCRPALNEKKYFAVDIPEGQLTVEYCDITSEGLACVAIHSGTAFLNHCQIHDSRAGGIYVYDNGKGRIEHCDIFANAYPGIQIKEGGNPQITHCQIHDGQSSGIVVSHQGKGEISYCTIYGNAYAGIEINQKGDPVVQDCHIHDGGTSGFYIHHDGYGKIEQCEISGHAYPGITIKNGGEPIIKGCQIYDGKASGVLFSQEAKGKIEGCDIFANGRAGIKIESGSEPIVENCTIKQNAWHGIWVLKNGFGTIIDCDLRGNEKGAFDIEADSEVQSRGNQA
jgi:parallel beta-helix repeat protein